MILSAFLRRTFLICCAAFLCLTGMVHARETVKVGFIGPLTGGLSAIGIGGRNSAELAVKEFNENPDRRFDYLFVAYDDECKPNIGVQVATKAASDRKMAATLAHYCSAVALGTVDIFHRFHMPAMVWGAVHPDITYGNNHKEIFRTPGTMINQNQVAARFMTGQGYKTFAIIHDITDYGKSHKDYFTKFIGEQGGKVLGTFGVTSDQQDFTAELTRIKALKPDVIYFGGLVPVGVRVRSQMAKLGIDAQFEGVSGIKSDAFITGLGDEVAEGALSFVEGVPLERLPGGEAFEKSYASHGYKESPEAYGPFAYVGMKQVLEAIEAEGPKRDKIVAYLSAIKGQDTLVGKVSYDDHGQNTEPAISTYVVQDGRWVFWQDSEYASGKRQLNHPNK